MSIAGRKTREIVIIQMVMGKIKHPHERERLAMTAEII